MRIECLREVGIELRGKDTFHKNDVGIFFGKPDKTVPDPYFERTGTGADRVHLLRLLHGGVPGGGQKHPGQELSLSGRRQRGPDHSRNRGHRRAALERRIRGLDQTVDRPYAPQRTYSAKGVVFSGGVLGTVKLLMQCRQKGLLPNLSPQLGNYVRTNSEAILGVMSRDKSVDWNDQIAITSGIYADDTTHIEMVRYNKGSDVLLNLLTLMTDGGGTIPRGVRFPGQILRHPLRFIKLLWPFGKAASTTHRPGHADG